MSLVVRATFPVRGNEVGFTGVVPPGTIARYCEAARWGIFGHPVLRELGSMPSVVARAQTIEIASDLTHPSEIVVSSYVARIGRTSLDFGHELTREDGSLVARARVTVVAVGSEGPVPVPPALSEIVVPRAVPDAIAHPGEPPSDAFSHAWIARPSDQDRFRHVNQAKYVDFADDARHFAARAGHAAGFEAPIAALTVAYEREAHAGDPVELRLWSVEDGRRAIELRHATTGVVLNRAVLRPSTGRVA